MKSHGKLGKKEERPNGFSMPTVVHRLLPELGRGFSRVAAEETGKVGWLLEAEFLGDFLDRKVGGRKQHLDFNPNRSLEKVLFFISNDRH